MSMETIGTKTAWQLWAESVKSGLGEETKLKAEGWFTARDMAAQTGWSYEKSRKYLAGAGLKQTRTYDTRVRNITTFYFPPA